jgi:hypothetical protein
MPAIWGRNSSESLRKSEVFQSREAPRLKRSLLITVLVALASFVTSSVVGLEDTPVFGKVTTKKKTALKAAERARGRGNNSGRQHGFALGSWAIAKESMWAS